MRWISLRRVDKSRSNPRPQILNGVDAAVTLNFVGSFVGMFLKNQTEIYIPCGVQEFFRTKSGTYGRKRSRMPRQVGEGLCCCWRMASDTPLSAPSDWASAPQAIPGSSAHKNHLIGFPVGGAAQAVLAAALARAISVDVGRCGEGSNAQCFAMAPIDSMHWHRL